MGKEKAYKSVISLLEIGTAEEVLPKIRTKTMKMFPAVSAQKATENLQKAFSKPKSKKSDV